MHIEFDASKNETNIRIRGLPLLAARIMFTSDLLVREDIRQAYPEQRFVGYNSIAGRLMVVVFCMPSQLQTHIISFRKANSREQKKFNTQSL